MLLSESIGLLESVLRTRENDDKQLDADGNVVKDEKGKPVYVHPQVTQTVTYDFTGASDELVEDLLLTALDIKFAQKIGRAKGTAWMQANPTPTVKVTELATMRKAAAKPKTVEELIAECKASGDIARLKDIYAQLAAAIGE